MAKVKVTNEEKQEVVDSGPVNNEGAEETKVEVASNNEKTKEVLDKVKKMVPEVVEKSIDDILEERKEKLKAQLITQPEPEPVMDNRDIKAEAKNRAQPFSGKKGDGFYLGGFSRNGKNKNKVKQQRPSRVLTHKVYPTEPVKNVGEGTIK